MTRAEAFQLISQERIHQEQKFGKEHHDVATWLDIIHTYASRAIVTHDQSDEKESLRTLVKIAALAVAVLEDKARFIEMRRITEKQNTEVK
jgi:hypothetical protein